MTNFTQRLLAFILLVLSTPIILSVGIVIFLLEFDSIFFLQERLGQHKIPFTIYKFRTMTGGKITRIGRIIRKTGIDEIPQLLNIIKGDLLFIGPRPLTLFDVERLEWTSSFYLSRWNVKPGLTGLAQLSPICHKKMTIFWDKYYVKHQSFKLNLAIIFASVLTLIIGKKSVKLIIQKKLNA